MSKILWEPAAAISIALLATCCPITSEKSIASILWIVLILFILFLRMSFLSKKWSINCCKLFTPIIFKPYTKLASSKLFAGTIIPVIPNFLAFIAIDKTPLTGLRFPSNDNSPITI